MPAMLPRTLPLLTLAAALLLPACNHCEPSDNPTVTLGRGQGDLFEIYEENEPVGLEPAPQGGFGVPVIIGTTGLQTELANSADATLDVYIDGSEEGTFLSTGLQLVCQSDSEGGRIHGQVVGLDPDTYVTNDDLLELNGTVVELRVTVTDTDGTEATGSQNVTIDYGG